ncbi:glutathione S-transferase protein [Dictyocaulus viviparus]|uniref:Glutathione S-transferase protein n=1 Tax=Dictyocaulus viviparus TaxID=29172 RepID=A0A0D8Y2X6_DICVI|nr:glutathione S-transferase protein [Dictyocaulus viviparus]
MTDRFELISLKVRGRIESVRLMLTFAGRQFTDTRLTISEWKQRKIKDGFYEDTRLPVMIINEKNRLIGVNDISRFVAKDLGLYGANDDEQKAIEVVIRELDELHVGLTPVIRATLTKNYEERRDIWNEFKAVALFPQLKFYETILTDKKLFLVGSRISWADIALIEMLTRCESCYDSFYLAHFPHLKAYCSRFESLSNIRPYIQSRPNSHF